MKELCHLSSTNGSKQAEPEHAGGAQSPAGGHDFAEITLTLELGLSLEQHYSTRQEAGCLKLQLEAY